MRFFNALTMKNSTGSDIMIEHRSLPISRILSANCRNFSCFRELEIFDFDERLNYIFSESSDSRKAAVDLISNALSPNLYSSNKIDENKTGSLIEITFVAGEKYCFLRRVIVQGSTTDLHLYVEEDNETKFYRDGEVIGFLASLIPIKIIKSRYSEGGKLWKFFNYDETESSSPPIELLKLLQGILRKNYNSETKKQIVIGDGYLDILYGGSTGSVMEFDLQNSKLWWYISEIGKLICDLDESPNKVIIIEELDAGVNKETYEVLVEIIEKISTTYGIQFIMTTSIEPQFNSDSHNAIFLPHFGSQRKSNNKLRKSWKNIYKVKKQWKW